MIELSQVSKSFLGKKQVTALHPTSLSVARGEMVAIVGPSGSGKSTLLNLVGGLDQPSTGRITIDGTMLSAVSDDALTRIRRDKIGIIFQFFNLLPSLTAEENVALPLHLRGWKRRDIDARARELLQFVGLAARAEHLPEELSGGERQRVAIARALSVNPPILLADEPTGNLDSSTGVDILGLIGDLNRQFQTTILLVTHDSTVAAACSRVVTLRDGRIVSDTAAQLLPQ